MGRGAALALMLWAAPFCAVASGDLVVGDFRQGDLTGWEDKVFHGETQYRFVDTDAGQALQATANASASGLFKKIKIDLTKTPCLTWDWKVDNVLSDLDETTKGGDDYSARVYVVVSTGVMFWQTHAISYVWSGAHKTGDVWPNAYTDKATMIAVESGPGKVGQWVRETRNILADVQRFVGEDITTADAVAVMTDSDDSGQSATAYYGNIRLDKTCN